MTKDAIMRMAREAGFMPTVLNHWPAELERFANLVAAHKAKFPLAEAYLSGHLHGMEAAAVICENLPVQQEIDVRDECAAAIRARGTT